MIVYSVWFVTLLLIVLKATGVVAMSWVAAFLPVIFALALGFTLIVLFVVVGMVVYMFEKKR